MSAYNDKISDLEKIKIVSDFVTNAPPGEFNEVFNDVRVLLGDDGVLKSGCAAAFAKYNKDSFIPVDVPNENTQTIISAHNEISGNVYYDPRSGKEFQFDHLRKQASQPQPRPPGQNESTRVEFQSKIDKYTNTFYKDGVCATYASNGDIVMVIEDHKYNPRNFWNGRWTSEWTIPANGGELKGTMKVVVHYYEAGNVQVHGSKEHKETISGSGAGLAEKVAAAIKKAESEYQLGINENYNDLVSTTFKALRRALPLTRHKLDWNKIHFGSVAASLKGN